MRTVRTSLMLPLLRLIAQQLGQKRETSRKYWPSRGGRTSKAHTAIYTKGRLLRLEISGGQLHDSQMMEMRFLVGSSHHWPSLPTKLMAALKSGCKSPMRAR